MITIYINVNEKKSKINKNIYGHFAEHLGRCIYNGIYVGEDSAIPNVNGMRNDVVDALRQIKIPVLRWPGGCFADEYHWKDGIGAKENRKKMVNTHWGGVVEDNSFGTHEFMELCRQLECEPYINGNVGSGTVQEMSEWVEYLTFNGVSPMAQLRAENGQSESWSVKYWGVGNENWGCGGNMRPEYYADLYRQFQTYIRNYGDNKIFKIACGANSWDTAWTDKVMEIAGKHMDAITLHYYTLPSDDWQRKGSATDFNVDDYYRTVKKSMLIEKLVSDHLQIMHKHDPDHKVGLIIDEWGTWYDVEPGTNPGFLYQQNTMRDAIIAAVTLNVFNKYSDRIIMANIAQTVNVLQAVILTEDDKIVLTPTYHVFNMYKHHQEATLVNSFVETELVGTDENKIVNLSVSSSVSDDGMLNITIANTSIDTTFPIDIVIEGMEASGVSGEILTGAMTAYNDFDNLDNIKTVAHNDIKIESGRLKLNIPACSVVSVRCTK